MVGSRDEAAPASRPAVVLDPAGEALAAAYALRHEVFVEEQQVPLELERDALDAVARHVVVLDADGRALATGRVLLKGAVAKMQRIAVRGELRRGGLGRVVMEALEGLAARQGCHTATLASQVEAIPFYERLGYQGRGERFVEAGILHRWMDKPLS